MRNYSKSEEVNNELYLQLRSLTHKYALNQDWLTASILRDVAGFIVADREFELWEHIGKVEDKPRPMRVYQESSRKMYCSVCCVETEHFPELDPIRFVCFICNKSNK